MTGQILSVPWQQVRPYSGQPRVEFDRDRLVELAASLKEQGQQVAIIVKAIGPAEYEIVDGERRWRATQLAKLSRIRIEIRDVKSDDDQFLGSVVANFGREGHTPLETMMAVKRVWSMPPYASMPPMERRERVGNLFARSPSWVDAQRRLMNLPDRVLELVCGVNTTRRLHAQVAALIASVRDPEEQVRVAEEIVAKGLDRRRALAAVRKSMKKVGATPGARMRNYHGPSRDAQGVLRALRGIRAASDYILDLPHKPFVESLRAKPGERERVIEDIAAVMDALREVQSAIKKAVPA